MRSLVGVGGEWLGIHRGLGGAHRPYPLLRHRHAWVQSIGVAAMAVVTGASIWLLLSGAALPTRARGPIILPAISVPRLLSPGPAGPPSKQAAPPPSTATPAGRAPGSRPLITPDSPSASTPPSAPPPSLVPELAPAPPPATSRPPCPPTKRHGKPSPLPTPHR